jgi:pimeloyl-ACP methyl ester carboxylesterase
MVKTTGNRNIFWNLSLLWLIMSIGFWGLDGKTHELTLLTRDKVKLAASYYQPIHEKAPGIILLHMFGRDRNDWHSLAKELQKNGYGCLSLDFRGHGKSLKKDQKTLNWREFTQKDYADLALDLEAGWVFLSNQSHIIKNRIAIIGASIGANIAMNFSVNHPEIKTLALLSPGLNYRGINIQGAISKLGDRSLFIAVSKEDFYSANSSAKLQSLAKGKVVLKTYTGSSHGTRLLKQEKELVNILIQWLKENL